MVRNARAAEYEAQPQPVIAIGNIYPAGHHHPPHQHERAQLLHSMTGVMLVGTEHGTWVVPPQRAVWIPAGVRHEISMVGEVATRSVYLAADAVAQPPAHCCVVGVPPLLHSLLVEAVDLPVDYQADPRASLIMALIQHEVASLTELPLSLPFPSHARLARRCRQFLAAPTARETIDDWAATLHMSRRAFTRLFRRETGLSLAAWRQQASLVAALPRLIQGEPVTSVALDLGYASVTAFTSMFRRVLGASPSRYLSLSPSRASPAVPPRPPRQRASAAPAW